MGGGVAVMDCNGDALPDIFAAGGSQPAALFVNQGDFAFTTAALPKIIDTTGAYPIDINADGYMDLFVLRIGPNVVLKGARIAVSPMLPWNLNCLAQINGPLPSAHGGEMMVCRTWLWGTMWT